MRRLLLLRHAKTEKESASGADRDRRLDARGRDDAPTMGRYLARENLIPDLALVSSAARAAETWELLAAALDGKAPPTITDSDLYHADAGQLLRIIRTAAGQQPNVMLVLAHNPGLHEIALTMTRTAAPEARAALAESMPTCGLAVLDFDVGDWHDIAFRAGHLERFVSPRRLRTPAG